MNRLSSRSLLCCIGLVAACGPSPDDSDMVFVPFEGGVRPDLRHAHADLAEIPDGGSCSIYSGPDGGAADAPLGADGGAICLPDDPAGPMVTFAMPLDGAVVAGKSIDVTVVVTTRAGEHPVASVTLLAPAIAATAPMALTATPNTYEGRVDVSAVVSGPLVLAAVATDIDGHAAAAAVTVVRDGGPHITVYQPQARTYRGSAPVLFSVDNPSGDARLDLDPTTLAATVQQVAVTVTPVSGQSPPTWSGTIDFHATAFGQALMGDQVLHIVAKDKQGTAAAVDVPFTVDEVGPTIVITAPLDGKFVGGVTQVVAQIDDPSGVDGPTAVVVWAGDSSHAVPLVQKGTTDVYTGYFDTRQLDPSIVLPAVSVRASDQLGNQSEQSEHVIVDNVAERISLDPPPLHFRRVTDMVCSHPLDPVGSDALNDGDIAPQLENLRARIEDEGNIATGQSFIYLSETDPTTPHVYFIRASDGPIVVDTDGDGLCDDVNPDLVPTTSITMAKQFLALPLVPVPVAGAPDFSAGTPDAVCSTIGTSTDIAPKPLCMSSPVIFDTFYTQNHATPAIWTIGPVVGAPDLRCQGTQFDAGNNIPDGPVCVAVRSSDNVGNRNVSAPLRLCLDKKLAGTCDTTLYQPHDATLATNHASLPDCTGTVVNGKVDGSKPCKPGVHLNTGTLLTPPFPATQIRPF